MRRTPGKTLITLGECMVELAPQQDGAFRMGFAGDAFNMAWYARQALGADWTVGFASALGQDPLSEQMIGFMQAEGIDTGSIRRVPDRTPGLYMITLDQGERSFAYWRGQSAARTLADDPDWLKVTLSRADVVLLSGITLAILPPQAREALIALLGQLRGEGVRIAFDTNLRQRLWEDATTMRGVISAAAGVADIVLPSFDEERDVFGDADPAATLGRYAQAGAKLVVVKNGVDPLTVWSIETGAQTFRPMPAPRILDTTAAGDSFNAGFLARHLEGGSLAQAARAGMALSAQVVQGQGALVAGLDYARPT